MKKTLLSWSSGKDSAFALHLLRQDPRIDLIGLFTVVNETYGRNSLLKYESLVLLCALFVALTNPVLFKGSGV